MNKYFFTAILCGGFAINQLYAQNIKPSNVDNNISKDFKGIVVLDGRVLEKKLALICIDLTRIVTYTPPNNVPDSLIDIDADCKYGILVLSSSVKPPLAKYSTNLENILLNYKAIFDDVGKEPD